VSTREQLYQMVIGIRARMFPDADPTEDLTHRLGERGSKPTGMIKRAIERIRFNESDDEPAKPVPVEQDKPVPSSYTEVWTGRSAQVNLNQEFDGSPFCDNETTSNWRKSLNQKPPVPQNEVNALDNQAVERALKIQEANVVIAFPKVSLK
jgi:hypothetical protein